MKRFYQEQQLQVYMNAFMDVDPETIPEQEYFSATKIIFENYKKMSTPGPVPKIWL